MKNTIITALLILLGVLSFTANGQNYLEFKTELIKKHSPSYVLYTGEGTCVFQKLHSKIEKIELDIFPDKDIELYSVNMTCYLGYHVDEVNGLFSFDTFTKEIVFANELWYEGLLQEFYCNLLYSELQNENAIKKFVADFEKLLRVNNPNVRFENIYYEEYSTTFYQTNLNKGKQIRELERIIVLRHPNKRLLKIGLVDPDCESSYILE